MLRMVFEEDDFFFTLWSVAAKYSTGKQLYAREGNLRSLELTRASFLKGGFSLWVVIRLLKGQQKKKKKKLNSNEMSLCLTTIG